MNPESYLPKIAKVDYLIGKDTAAEYDNDDQDKPLKLVSEFDANVKQKTPEHANADKVTLISFFR